MKSKLFSWKNLLIIMALIMMQGNNSCTGEEIDPGDSTPLTYHSPSSITPPNAVEMAEIVITASGGTLPYEFYVIPETQWHAGDMMYDMLLRNDFSRLHRYTYSRNLFGSHTFKIEVASGTSSVPRYYWVAVQDKNETNLISGSYMGASWLRIAVYGL